MKKKRIVFIVGPTAVGKTDVAFFVAQTLKGEVVSCDAMQVYKGVEILISKTPLSLRRKIKHHLIDVVSLTEDFDVAAYRKLALAAMEKIHFSGKPIVVAGGSGMYMKVLLDGIFSGSARNPAVCQDLEEKAERDGNAALYAQLQQVDPQAARKIHANDTRRIVRALEVYFSAKQPISDLQKTCEGLWGNADILLFSLNRDRTELYDRINQRVDAMFAEGAVNEVQKMDGVHLSRTAAAIIGVKEIRGYLAGEYDLERAKYLMKLHTRHLAKRQLTWFRREERLHWVDIHSTESPQDVAQKIIHEIGIREEQHDARKSSIGGG